jgi:hypothetical protein
VKASGITEALRTFSSPSAVAVVLVAATGPALALARSAQAVAMTVVLELAGDAGPGPGPDAGTAGSAEQAGLQVAWPAVPTWRVAFRVVPACHPAWAAVPAAPGLVVQAAVAHAGDVLADSAAGCRQNDHPNSREGAVAGTPQNDHPNREEAEAVAAVAPPSSDPAVARTDRHRMRGEAAVAHCCPQCSRGPWRARRRAPESSSATNAF